MEIGNEGLQRMFSEIREELDSVYSFHDSQYGFYVLNPKEPTEGFFDIIDAVGMDKKRAEEMLDKYISGNTKASCFYMNGKMGYDYIIIIPSGIAQGGILRMEISHETMHGEHSVVHAKNEEYTSLYSIVLREFFGESGFCQISRNICLTTPDHFSDKPTCSEDIKYNPETDRFTFYPDIIGYKLAQIADRGEPEWKREMFHEHEEPRVWATYNELIVPHIKIGVPPALENTDEIMSELGSELTRLGLKCTIEPVVNESDIRGM